MNIMDKHDSKNETITNSIFSRSFDNALIQEAANRAESDLTYKHQLIQYILEKDFDVAIGYAAHNAIQILFELHQRQKQINS